MASELNSIVIQGLASVSASGMYMFFVYTNISLLNCSLAIRKGCSWSFATQNTFSAGFQKCLLFLTRCAFPWLQSGEEYQYTESAEDVKKEWLVYLSGTGGIPISPLTQVGIKTGYA